MNFFKKSLYLCASLIAGAFLLSSCDIDSDDTLGNLCYANAFGNVIEGESSYTLQLDNGYWMEFSKNVVNMGDAKRAYIECYFYANKIVTSGSKTYIEPSQYQLYKVGVEETFNEVEAIEKHINDNDSTFSFSSYSCIVQKGYLSSIIYTPYVNSVLPSAHLYFNTSEITADTAAIHLVVNRHSSASTAGYCYLHNSFELDKLGELCQNSDSITLALYTSSSAANPSCLKVAVSDLKRPVEEEK